MAWDLLRRLAPSELMPLILSRLPIDFGLFSHSLSLSLRRFIHLQHHTIIKIEWRSSGVFSAQELSLFARFLHSKLPFPNPVQTSSLLAVPHEW